MSEVNWKRRFWSNGLYYVLQDEAETRLQKARVGDGEATKLRRELKRTRSLLQEALGRLDFINTGTYAEIGPDDVAEAIRRYLRRHGLEVTERPKGEKP